MTGAIGLHTRIRRSSETGVAKSAAAAVGAATCQDPPEWRDRCFRVCDRGNGAVRGGTGAARSVTGATGRHARIRPSGGTGVAKSAAAAVGAATYQDPPEWRDRCCRVCDRGDGAATYQDPFKKRGRCCQVRGEDLPNSRDRAAEHGKEKRGPSRAHGPLAGRVTEPRCDGQRKPCEKRVARILLHPTTFTIWEARGTDPLARSQIGKTGTAKYVASVNGPPWPRTQCATVTQPLPTDSGAPVPLLGVYLAKPRPVATCSYACPPAGADAERGGPQAPYLLLAAPKRQGSPEPGGAPSPVTRCLMPSRWYQRSSQRSRHGWCWIPSTSTASAASRQ